MPTANGILWQPGQPTPNPEALPTPEDLPIIRSWALSKHVFEACFRDLSGRHDVEVGRVVNLGGGHYRNAASATIEIPGTPWSGDYIAVVPKREADAGLNARVVKEAVLLERLSHLELPFRVPRVIALYVAWGHCVLIRESMPGWTSEQPWDAWTVVAPLAAAIHRLDTALPLLSPRFQTRREHAQAELQAVRRERSELDPVYDWMQAHLPPSAPTVFVHGDLLTHNVLLNVYKQEEPPGVIDWEYAMQGDPAYDLAIITRGARKNERRIEGMLQAYQAAGGAAVTSADIRFYELCFNLRWYGASLDDEPYYDSPEQALHRLLGVLNRPD